MPQVVENVRKGDWLIDLDLPGYEGELAQDRVKSVETLINAIHRVKPSFIYPRLVMEVCQPVIGNVTNSIIRMCQRGVPACKLRTLFPDRPDLAEQEDCSHIIYIYGDGRIVEHETDHCRGQNGEKLLVHRLVAVFDKFRVETNEWDGMTRRTSRPALALVENTGSVLVQH